MLEIIEIVDRTITYRPNSARQKWLERLVEYESRPLNDFISSVTQDPPSTPDTGELAGELEPPAGWIRFFKNEGVLRLVSYDASIRETFQRIAANWAEYRIMRKVDKTAVVYQDVTEEIPQIIRSELGQEAFRFKVEGSTGRGNITLAPWIAVFETSVTTSATSGFYPVYLFSTDMARLYLAIGFGAQQFTDTFGVSKGREKIRQAVLKVRPLFDDRISAEHDIHAINLLAEKSKLHKGYEDGTIYCWSEYEVATLPSDKEMLRDLNGAVEFYDLMITDPLMPSIEDLVASAAPVAKSQIQTKTVEEVDFVPRQKKKRSPPSSTTTKSRARRSTQSKKVGRAGEEEIYHREVAILKKLGRTDLAEKVIPHYKIGETPGWDITSFNRDGDKLLIEVKSTVGKTMSTVELTRNEWKAAQDPEYRDRYFLYLVMGVFSKKLKIEKMQNPADHVLTFGLSIEPSVFELSLSAD